ncbi:AMP-binding enzyme [Helicosporidium sp. ATCC 50920]|nr:AMP-binding enzyme [Helicosporidium sp. ATCC 50920]|eukprot:KDD76920.1 AMP-binding enzyme [Helicosporidium sp. ATCC 50920]
MTNYKYITAVAPGQKAEGDKKETGPTYRCTLSKEGPPGLEGVNNLWELFSRSVAKYGSSKCLGKRTATGFDWLTYSEASEQAAAVGSALLQKGMSPGSRIGVYGANTTEWMLAMQACNRQGLHCVPLYDSLGDNAVEFIVRHSETSAVFALGAKLGELSKAVASLGDQVKLVVHWGTPAPGPVQALKDAGVEVLSFAELVTLGREKAVEPAASGLDDVCTIMYTSGTTGDPKGVVLSHGAVISTVVSLVMFCDSVGAHFDTSDSLLSFLPLAHIFDRAAEELMLYSGASIGYWGGDVKALMNDLAALRPTVFASVPRVFDRVYSAVHGRLEKGGFFKRALFNWGYGRKLDALRKGAAAHKAAPIFDRLVFSKVAAGLGGRCRFIISGGAPIAQHVEEFLRVTMCCGVIQGYGLTESCAASFLTCPDDPAHGGTVGPPQPVVSFRLEAVPEMNYLPSGSPEAGEVCIKGPSLFQGYYKDQEKTDEVLDSDGWFHTGDIGIITPTGALKIVDRKKNIFKLSQGEYIAVEKVENVYKGTPGVEQVWVYGNSFESCLVAVVVPTKERFDAFAAAAHKAGQAPEELARDPALAAALLVDLTAQAKEGKLKGFEQVRKVHVETELFSVENELMTPTFKLKRPQLQQRYQKEVDAMYASMK